MCKFNVKYYLRHKTLKCYYYIGNNIRINIKCPCNEKKILNESFLKSISMSAIKENYLKLYETNLFSFRENDCEIFKVYYCNNFTIKFNQIKLNRIEWLLCKLDTNLIICQIQSIILLVYVRVYQIV